MTTTRQAWLSLLATCDDVTFDRLWDQAGITTDYAMLREPEVGTTMVQGRMGGTGDAFNLGEMTVTRCSLCLKNERQVVGHAYIQGRNKQKAKSVALCDALLQTVSPLAAQIEEQILVPLKEQRARKQQTTQQKAAATKVEFFTLMRGDD